MALPAAAQPGKIPRIGFLRTDTPPRSYVEAFEQGLRARGYIPGTTILIEYRFGDGSDVMTVRMAREIVALNVDAIVAGGGRATRVVQSVTSTIPIVMTSASDPVGTGLVASLSHPGGNTTGTSIVSWDLFAKRLELLRQVLPDVDARCRPDQPQQSRARQRLDQRARRRGRLGITLQRVDVGGAADFDEAFAAMARARAEALIVMQSTIFETSPYRIQQLATSYRIPAIYGVRTSTDAGGLMSYGPNVPALYNYAAVYVDKILKGAKPGDLPVEQPTKFELIVNMKTAKALGLTMPQSILLRADQLIE